MSLPAFNPMGSSFSMSPPPPQGYVDYFNSLKNIPPNKNVNSNSVVPLDKKKLEQLKALNDYKNMIKEKNKILPISHYTKHQEDKAHQGVNEEIHYTSSIKPSKTPVRDIHISKHISPKEHLSAPSRVLTGIHTMAYQNRMRLEQGMSPLPIEHYYPVKTKINMNMNLPPKVKKAVAVSDAVSKEIAKASKDPTPKIKNNDTGSFANPSFSKY